MNEVAIKPLLTFRANTLQLTNIKRTKPLKGFEPSGSEKSLWADVRVDNLFVLSGCLLIHRPDDSGYKWSMAEGNGYFRFWDSPFQRSHTGQTGPEFSYGIYEYIHEQLKDGKLDDYCLEKVDSPPEFPALKPPSWEGQDLIIPIEYIRLAKLGVNDSGNWLTTHLGLGRHLSILDITIYRDGQLIVDERLLDPALRDLVQGLLNHEDVLDKLKPHFGKWCGAGDWDFSVVHPSNIVPDETPVQSLYFAEPLGS